MLQKKNYKNKLYIIIIFSKENLKILNIQVDNIFKNLILNKKGAKLLP